MRSRLIARHPWIVLSAACLVPAVLDSLQIWVKGRLSPDGPNWPWVLWQGGEWIILGTLIPLTWVFGRRYPIRRPHVARHLAIHAGGALLLCIGWATVGSLLGRLLGTAPAGRAGWVGTPRPRSGLM
jgi:hypothetical protein